MKVLMELAKHGVVADMERGAVVSKQRNQAAPGVLTLAFVSVVCLASTSSSSL